MILHAALPIIAGIFAGIGSHFSHWCIISGPWEQQISILGTVVQVSVSMMGFMLAALAILASITDKPLVKNMAKMGHYQDLLLSLFVACLVYMFSFLVSGSVLVVGDIGIEWRQVLIGALISNVTATLQIGWKFWKVLSNLKISD